MTIQTTYKGYTVRLSDNEDVWRCHDLDLTDASLRRIKDRIDKAVLSARKKAAVRAVMVTSQGKLIDATVVEYLGDSDRRWGSEKDRVAIMSPAYGDGSRLARQVLPITRLFPDTPETAAKAAVIRDLIDRARNLEKQAATVLENMDRLTLDDIADLVKLAETTEAANTGCPAGEEEK